MLFGADGVARILKDAPQHKRTGTSIKKKQHLGQRRQEYTMEKRQPL